MGGGQLEMKYLVTGTTSGIGKCIKQKLQGHELFEINRADVDLNRPELLLSVDLPVVDYAILNAGHDLGGGVPFADHESVSIQKILNCNLVSNVLITQKLLKNNPDTVIVLITSTNINRQYPNNLAYNLSKLGLKNLYDLIKIDYPDSKIKEARIGLTKTEFNNNRHKGNHKPINDLYTMKHMTPKNVADSILYLINSEADFMELNAE
jgi:NADP-dependent 3-hydroxy acid dehydrogenase YdfG